jgi:hypothetical protein
MTWKKFIQGIYEQTEKQVNKYLKQIYTSYYSVRNSINDILKDNYSNHLTGVDPDDYYDEMLKHKRLDKMTEQIKFEYLRNSRKVGKLMGKAGELSISNVYYKSQYAFSWLIDKYKSKKLPDSLIKISVYGSDKAYKRYTKTLGNIFGQVQNYMPKSGTLSSIISSSSRKEYDNIMNAVTQGLLNGDSYTKTSKAVAEIIGRITKDGVSGSMANATRIVRTESTRIMNDASLANTEYARSQGIDVVRIWNATLDGKTRPVHRRLDNKPENPETGGWQTSAGFVSAPGRWPTVKQNANDRCSTYESIDGSRPELRRGVNPVTGDSEVFEYQSYDQWMVNNNLAEDKNGKIIPKK